VTQSALPEPFLNVDRLLEAGDIASAKAAFEAARQSAPDPDLVELFEIQIAILGKQIEPDMGLTRIVSVMRRAPKLPFAKELFQRISTLAYTGGQSSLSHSHPPPPPMNKK